MPESGFPIAVVPGKQFNRCIFVNWPRSIPNLAVNFGGQDVSCQTFGDRKRYLIGCNSFFILPNGTVGKCNMNHVYVVTKDGEVKKNSGMGGYFCAIFLIVPNKKRQRIISVSNQPAPVSRINLTIDIPLLINKLSSFLH